MNPDLDPNSGGTVIGEGKVVKPLAVGWQDEDHGPTSILGGRSIVVHVYWGFLR